jgi:hypothetical protein
MLRIILKFDDVVGPVVAAHQLGLRPAAHPPHVLDGQLHGRHASHGNGQPQADCSVVGNRENLEEFTVTAPE